MNVHVAAPPPEPATEPRLLPELAEKIKIWFTDLNGRAIAVSDSDIITKLNVPTLPLVAVGLKTSVGDQSTSSYQPTFSLAEQILIQFWLEPMRYKRKDGSEAPFWTWYDYESVRETLVANLSRWEDAPHGARFAYRKTDIAADELAVTITFTFLASYQFCTPDPRRGERFIITTNLCTPKGCCIEEDCFEVKENEKCDPCP